MNKEIPEIESELITDAHFFDSYNKKVFWTVEEGLITIIGGIVFGKGTFFKHFSVAVYEIII